MMSYESLVACVISLFLLAAQVVLLVLFPVLLFKQFRPRALNRNIHILRETWDWRDTLQAVAETIFVIILDASSSVYVCDHSNQLLCAVALLLPQSHIFIHHLTDRWAMVRSAKGEQYDRIDKSFVIFWFLLSLMSFASIMQITGPWGWQLSILKMDPKVAVAITRCVSTAADRAREGLLAFNTREQAAIAALVQAEPIPATL